MLDNQITYNQYSEALEKQYNQASVKNAQDRADAITDINKKLGQTNLDIQKEQNQRVFDEIESRFNDRVNSIQSKTIDQAQKILRLASASASIR